MVFHKLIGTVSLISLSACATFDGRPTPVITLQKADKLIAAYAPDHAIATIGQIPASDVAGRNSYRNRVIAAYLTAIDAHYDQFARELSRSGKGTHLGLDSALLLLTGAGAIFSKAASNLSAGATAVGGFRGSFDRELFSDKTLPIVLTVMDTRRLAVRADILRGSSTPESIYTLEDAFSDLVRYEGAGTIDGALSNIAASAGDEARTTQVDFAKAKDLCVVDDSTDVARRSLELTLEQFEVDAENATDAQSAESSRASVQQVAQALGVSAATAPADRIASLTLLAAIRDQIEAQCSTAGVNALRTKITTAGITLK